MTPVEVGDISGRDIGRRAIVVEGENIVEGVLDDLWFNRTHKGEPKVQLIEIKTEMGEFKLSSLPLDFVIQIDRTPVDEPAVSGREDER